MERGVWERGFEGQHGCFTYHCNCKQAMCSRSLFFLIIEPFLCNVNASMGEVYYGELIKGSEIGAHMARPWGIASIMAALRLICTQRLRLNVKYVYTVIGNKDCDHPSPPISSSIPLSERGSPLPKLPLLFSHRPRYHFVKQQRSKFNFSINTRTFWLCDTSSRDLHNARSIAQIISFSQNLIIKNSY